MNYFQKVTLIICCMAFCFSTNAQSALEKAESYAKMDAPFLSIKYLQKHIQKEKNDRSAMRLLANAYLNVNMASQGQKWLLKANNIPTVISYFQRINDKVMKTKVAGNDKNIEGQLSPTKKTGTNLSTDHLMLVASLSNAIAIVI